MQSQGPRPFAKGLRSPIVAPITRGLLALPLFFFAASTRTSFAWTILPPLTAAILGANYFASAALAVFASRETLWANGRVSVTAAVVFAPVITTATYLHLSLFHTHASGFTLVVTWFWLIAYALYPVQLVVVLARQLRMPGTDPPRTAPLPTWVRTTLFAHATVLLPVGVLMFVSQGTIKHALPWDLTPLSSQVLAGWVLAFGAVALHAFLENDLARVRVALWTYPVMAALHVVAVLRYGDVLVWARPGAWIYVAYLASSFALGAYGLRAAMPGVRVAAEGRPVA
jgi:hypothetical protein